MATLQERLNMKRAPLDTWSIREKLFLALTVSRTGDQNWMSVSRSLKPFQENTRPADWFSQRNCAQQYGLLLENIETPKRKKRHSTSSSSAISASGTHLTSTSPNYMVNMDSSPANETPGEHIIRKLTWERVDELQKSILEKKAQYNQLRSEIQLLESGQITEEQLKAMYHEIQEEERQKEIKANEYVHWLNDRENRKMELERAWRPLIRTSSFNALKRKLPDFDKPDVHHDNIRMSVTVSSVVPAALAAPTVAPTSVAATSTAAYVPTVVVVKDREHTHLKPPPVSSVLKVTSAPSSTVSSSPLLSSLLKSPTSTANFHSNLFSTLLEKDISEQQSGLSSKNKQGQSSGSSSRTHTPVMDSQPATKVVTITTSALRNAILSKSPILISTVAPSTSNFDTNVSVTKPTILSALESQLPSLSASPALETASKSTQNETNQHSAAELALPAVTPLTTPDSAPKLRPKSPVFSTPAVTATVTPALLMTGTSGAENEPTQTTPSSSASSETPLLPLSLPSTSADTKELLSAESVADSKPEMTPIPEKSIPVFLTGVSNISSSQTNSDVTYEVITVQPSEVSQLNRELTVSSKITSEPEEEFISENDLASQESEIKEELDEVMEVESNERPSSKIDEKNDTPDDKIVPNHATDQAVLSGACVRANVENQERNSTESADERSAPEQIENKENSGHPRESATVITEKSVSIKDEVKDKAMEASDVAKMTETDAISDMDVSLELEITKTEESDNVNENAADAEEVVAVATETKEAIIIEKEDVVTDMETEVETSAAAAPISITKNISEKEAPPTETAAIKVVTPKKVSEQKVTAEVAEEPVKHKDQSDSVEEPQSLVRRTRLKRDYTRNTKLNRKADFDYEMNFNSDEFDEDSNNDSVVSVSSSSSCRKKEPTDVPKQCVDEKRVTAVKHPSKCASPWTDDEAVATVTATVTATAIAPSPLASALASASASVAASAGAKQTACKRVSNKRRISLDTESNSPSPVLSADEEREIRTVRKSFLLLYNRLVSHKYANHFMKPITDDIAPEYTDIIKQPMDFSTIKRNIDNCCTKTLADFKRDVLLMFNNAFMYNEPDSDVFLEAAQMQKDCIQMFDQFVEHQNQTHVSKRETRKSSKSVYKAKK